MDTLARGASQGGQGPPDSPGTLQLLAQSGGTITEEELHTHTSKMGQRWGRVHNADILIGVSEMIGALSVHRDAHHWAAIKARLG